MRAILTVTDLTRMQGNRVCVAGYLPDGTSARPVLAADGGITEPWLRIKPRGIHRWFREDSIVRPFSMIELEWRDRAPALPHCEDWHIAPTFRRWRGVLPPEEREELLRHIDDGAVSHIFGVPIMQGPGWYIAAGSGVRSLGTICPIAVTAVEFAAASSGNATYRLAFTDSERTTYRLAVTDLAFRAYLTLQWQRGNTPDMCAAALLGVMRRNPVWLRIGLTRSWAQYPDRCFLQITGVYTFPDYLGGRSFADFAAPHAQ